MIETTLPVKLPILHLDASSVGKDAPKRRREAGRQVGHFLVQLPSYGLALEGGHALLFVVVSGFVQPPLYGFVVDVDAVRGDGRHPEIHKKGVRGRGIRLSGYTGRITKNFISSNIAIL